MEILKRQAWAASSFHEVLAPGIFSQILLKVLKIDSNTTRYLPLRVHVHETRLIEASVWKKKKGKKRKHKNSHCHPFYGSTCNCKSGWEGKNLHHLRWEVLTFQTWTCKSLQVLFNVCKWSLEVVTDRVIDCFDVYHCKNTSGWTTEVGGWVWGLKHHSDKGQFDTSLW